jgi:hypothetical protein
MKSLALLIAKATKNKKYDMKGLFKSVVKQIIYILLR